LFTQKNPKFDAIVRRQIQAARKKEKELQKQKVES